MNYDTAQGFRQALEVRIRNERNNENVSLDLIRKQVVFERFIARLLANQPDAWILKGGLAMQLRLGSQTRTTRDIDFLHDGSAPLIAQSLSEAARLDLGDWFTFHVVNDENEPDDLYGGQRFNIHCLLDGRTFERFHIDVGVDDLLLGDAEYLKFSSFLDFAGLEAVVVPSYSATQQIAEKVHALTRTYAGGQSSRMKDMVDILLLAKINEIDGEKLTHDIQATFDRRASHEIPNLMPAPNRSLRREFNRLNKDLRLEYENMEAAHSELSRFIEPILRGKNVLKWKNNNWD